MARTDSRATVFLLRASRQCGRRASGVGSDVTRTQIIEARRELFVGEHGACRLPVRKSLFGGWVPLSPINRQVVDRRQGAGRRINRDRRREAVLVQDERRSGIDRRSPVPRRSGEHRRGAA